MSALRPLLRLAWRESRFARRRLLLFLSSISLGVGALVATHSFAANLAQGVRDQSRALLGADAAVSSNRPIPAPVQASLDSARAAGIGVTRQVSFASMALEPATGATRLAQVRAVEPGYPFYGEIVTAPAGRWESLSTGRHALADASLLNALGAAVGDSISLGQLRFQVTGTLERVPGDVGAGAVLAPRIYIPARFLEGTGLVQFGSRADYETLLRFPSAEAAEQWTEARRGLFRSERVRARTAEQQQQRLEESLGRMGAYLGLIGVFALLLGGIGVASAMSAYMAQKRETVATLRCLGATGPQVTAIYLLQAGAMGLAGAALGVLLGVATQWVLPRLVRGLLPVEVETSLDPLALLTGLGVGVWVAVAFALLPLLAARRISPLEAIRRRTSGEPIPGGGRDVWTWVARVLLAASVVALVVLQVEDPVQGAGVALGIGATLALLWATAWLVVRGFRGARTAGLGYPVRQGLANLHRPGNQTRTVVLSLGFGVFLLATLYLVQDNLLRPLRPDVDGLRANLVMLDVQDDQRAGVDSVMRGQGVEVLGSIPIVPMRVAQINGVEASRIVPLPDSVEAGPPEGGQARGPEGWAVRREYRSTYRDAVIPSETVVAGEFWDAGGGTGADGVFEVSLEEEIAQELGVALGDRITWDVQGVRIPTRVTSLREVDWRRLEPNFFAVFPTAALEAAPQTWVMLGSAGSAAERAGVQTAAVRRFPNVMAIDLTQAIAALDEVLGRVALVIRFLAGFSVATGFIVLLGAILTSRLQRVRESVLLRTLGATRRQIGTILLAEYLALGLAAALAGTLLATGAGWALAKWVFKMDFGIPVVPLLVLALATAALSGLIGLWASREVFRHTPLEMLREE